MPLNPSRPSRKTPKSAARGEPAPSHITCWVDLPSDICNHVLRGCTLHAMMRMALVNQHWALQVGVVLADPWTWAESHLDATADRLGIPRCPKENAIVVVPKGVASDCERLHAELLDASWTVAIPAGSEAGQELSYLLPTEMYFGGCTDDASLGIKKATGNLPNGRPLGLPDELPPNSNKEEESDGEESADSDFHSSDDDYSDSELEERMTARRALREDTRSRAQASRQVLVTAGKWRRLQDKDRKNIDKIQRERLAAVLGVLRAATFRMSATDACDLLTRVIASGVVGLCYCRRAEDTAKDPMSFAEVVGRVLASGLRGPKEQWEPGMLASLCGSLLPYRMSAYMGFFSPRNEHGASRRARQIHGADDIDDLSSARGSLLECQRQDQLMHPLWDVNAVIQPLRVRSWVSDEVEAILVGMLSRESAEATRALYGNISESAEAHEANDSEAGEEAEGEEDNEEDNEAVELATFRGSVGWRESINWVQYYHTTETRLRSDGGVYAEPCIDAAKRMGRAAAVAKVCASDVAALALALAEQEDAIMILQGHCPQHGHEFSSAAFLHEWAKVANFPLSWSPADRACLIELLSDEPETPRRGHYDPRNKGEGKAPEFSEEGFEQDLGCWGRYVRYELDEYLTAPVAPVVISWLRVLAQKAGQLSQ